MLLRVEPSLVPRPYFCRCSKLSKYSKKHWHSLHRIVSNLSWSISDCNCCCCMKWWQNTYCKMYILHVQNWGCSKVERCNIREHYQTHHGCMLHIWFQISCCLLCIQKHIRVPRYFMAPTFSHMTPYGMPSYSLRSLGLDNGHKFLNLCLSVFNDKHIAYEVLYSLWVVVDAAVGQRLPTYMFKENWIWYVLLTLAWVPLLKEILCS